MGVEGLGDAHLNRGGSSAVLGAKAQRLISSGTTNNVTSILWILLSLVRLTHKINHPKDLCFQISKLFLIVVSLCGLYTYEYRCPWEPEVADPPGARVTGSCEPLDVGTEN